MNFFKISSSFAIMCLSLSTVSAMEMNNQGSMVAQPGTMMKQDTSMMKDTMSMYENTTPMSSKDTIAKLQMMLVKGGHLVMPRGVAYGYYGPLTKAAFMKYKKSMMMTGTNTMMQKNESMTMQSSSTMNNDTMMAH